MANYYTDHPEFEFHLNHPLMKRIVELKERNFADKDEYADAPVDYQDALENYKRVLEITGDIAANVLEPNSEEVDLEGPHLVDGRMHYASKTYENLDVTRKAGLWGISMPRRYGGLNMPVTPYSMASEIVAAADAGFQNIWSLQDCIETLYEFGNEEQRQKYIPRVCAGETMSMDLTEPDAGSDLQRVMLKATYSEEEGCWLLNGVKRFITNGDSDIHLVLARSEAGTHDGRGLSMFIYDKRQGGVTVRHIENKLGIHGSPTCELVYKNAKAELCGNTRMGLIKYVMALMNGARLGGTTTMGKGTIQSSPQRLSDGSAVVITVAKLVCGDGSCFDGTGLTVDVERALSTEEATNFYDYTPQTDPQVQRAVSAAQQLSGTTTLAGASSAAAADSAASSAAADDTAPAETAEGEPAEGETAASEPETAASAAE